MKLFRDALHQKVIVLRYISTLLTLFCCGYRADIYNLLFVFMSDLQNWEEIREVPRTQFIKPPAQIPITQLPNQLIKIQLPTCRISRATHHLTTPSKTVSFSSTVRRCSKFCNPLSIVSNSNRAVCTLVCAAAMAA